MSKKKPQSSEISKHFFMKQIGQGSHSRVYQENNYAIKVESLFNKQPQLGYEYKVLTLIQGNIGIPKVYGFHESKDSRFLRMELLGPSLQDLFQIEKFSLKQVCIIAIQVLSRLEYLHSKCFIHRDVKPDNFVLKDSTIYMIDFGLALKYCHPKTKEHMPYSENKKFVGTPRYGSLFAHLGIQQSRRDDLMSLGYMLVYFMKHSLPWQSQSNPLKKKMMISFETLTKSLPHVFYDYFIYVDSLKFTEEPDYHFLRLLFLRLLFLNDFYTTNVKLLKNST